MTSDLKWSNIDIDHVKPLSLFVVCKAKHLKEGSDWTNVQLVQKKSLAERKLI